MLKMKRQKVRNRFNRPRSLLLIRNLPKFTKKRQVLPLHHLIGLFLIIGATTFLCFKIVDHFALMNHAKDLVAALERSISNKRSGPVKAEVRKDVAAVERFVHVRNKIKKKDARIVFLGDSIVRGFELQKNLWNRLYAKRGAVNAGIGSDRFQHILYRVKHGQLGKVKPKVVVLQCGINNIVMNSSREIAQGIKSIIRAIHKESPKTKILVLGLFPSGQKPNMKIRKKIRVVNSMMADFEQLPGVIFADIGNSLLTANGNLSKNVSYDGVHLTSNGYKIWAHAMEPHLRRIL